MFPLAWSHWGSLLSELRAWVSCPPLTTPFTPPSPPPPSLLPPLEPSAKLFIYCLYLIIMNLLPGNLGNQDVSHIRTGRAEQSHDRFQTEHSNGMMVLCHNYSELVIVVLCVCVWVGMCVSLCVCMFLCVCALIYRCHGSLKMLSKWDKVAKWALRAQSTALSSQRQPNKTVLEMTTKPVTCLPLTSDPRCSHHHGVQRRGEGGVCQDGDHGRRRERGGGGEKAGSLQHRVHQGAGWNHQQGYTTPFTSVPFTVKLKSVLFTVTLKCSFAVTPGVFT